MSYFKDVNVENKDIKNIHIINHNIDSVAIYDLTICIIYHHDIPEFIDSSYINQYPSDHQSLSEYVCGV